MEKDKLKGMVFAALFAALTAAVAWFKIPLPFTPVPITLQTLVVLLSGAMLGSYYGALSMILYIIVGSLGLPVFAGGSSGIGALLGPTGGYLFSYPVAAFAIGRMLEKKKLNNFIKYSSFVAVIGLIIIVFLDSIAKIGIISFLSGASESVRMLIATLSGAIILLTSYTIIYSKKSKLFSADVALAMFAGTLIIYILGSVQGKIVTGLPWGAIFTGWVLPFIVGDTIKLLLAAHITKSVDIKKYMR